MKDLILFALLGLGSGVLIGGLGLSVVVSYRGSGLVNIATGAVALLGAYAYFGLRTAGYLFLPPFPFVPHRIDFGDPMGVVPACVIALLLCLFVGGLFDVVVMRRLRAAAPLAKLIASLGLFLSIQATIILRFGTDGNAAPNVLPGSNGTVSVFGDPVPSSQFVLLGILVVVTAVLMTLYRKTRFGLATQAAAEDETSAMLTGLAPGRLSLANAAIASILAGAFGILVAPLTQLDPSTLALAVVPALGAALFASFTSLPIVAATGVGMGVLASIITYLETKSWFPTSNGGAIPGVTDVVYLVLIIIATFWRGAAVPARGMLAQQRLPDSPRPNHILGTSAIALVVCAVALVVLPFDFRQALINTLIATTLCLSLVVITGLVGQISLVHLALAGIAGFVVSKLSVHAGIGFPLGPLIGVAAATAFGLVTAVSALRVRGINLAVVTLAAAVAIEQFGFDNGTWGAGATPAVVKTPHLLGINLGPHASFFIGDGKLPSPGFGLICLVVAVAIGAFVASLRRSDLGQQMLAVRSNDRAASAAAVNVTMVKLIAFGLSAAIAGIAGVLYSYNFGAVSTDRFSLVVALGFVAYAFMGGIATVSGAVFGGMLATEGIFGHAFEKWTGLPVEYELIFAGVALIATVMANPDGIAGGLVIMRRRHAARRAQRADGAVPVGAPGSADALGAGG